MLLGLGQEMRVNGAKAWLVLWYQQICRSQPRSLQCTRGHVTTPVAHIDRDIAEDIDQLQPLAKAHPVFQQKVVIQSRGWKHMRPAHFRPELPHASRYTIGVIIQFLLRFKSNNALGRCVGESPQVKFLSACDDRQDFAYELPV